MLVGAIFKIISRVYVLAKNKYLIQTAPNKVSGLDAKGKGLQKTFQNIFFVQSLCFLITIVY